ncbi:MAG TPA: HAMP domain-containing sensor histidine kinase [bacterium]|nr:HAMP domain-containing sensor histidine kinase [bacterium]
MKPFAVGHASIRTYAFLAAMVLVIAIFGYTYSLVRSFEQQTEILTAVFAKFCASATYPATKNEEVRRIFNQVVTDVNFPIVITDPRGVPYTWKNIGADLNPDDVTWETFISTDGANPAPGILADVLKIVKQMDKQHHPVMMYDPAAGRFMGEVHYGMPAITLASRWLPLASALLLAVFVLVGYVGVQGIVVGERRSIWIGMAKETAHQLGTPLSSLMGWIQLLKERCADERTRDTVREMEKDVLRLGKISSRFGKVGAPPRLDKEDVVEVVRSAVDYQRRRLPSLGREVEIREHFGNIPKTLANSELLEWAVENLLKNSLDAMDKPVGIVEVRTTFVPRKGIISIEVEDNGKGIDPKVVKKIFEPGYSTRKGGWGLGLPLARRVVEEYHHGKLRLIRTGPEGSLFVIEIPAIG